MKKEQIIEGNRMISKFMGHEYSPDEGFDGFLEHGNFLPETELEYNSSWDWLMLVVGKIGEFHKQGKDNLEDEISWKRAELFQDGYLWFLNADKGKVYNACVKFIEWYNKTVQNTETISDSNRLLAEYLGASPNHSGEYEMYQYIEDIPDEPDTKHFYFPSEMKFHESWSWLMTAVEKMQELNYHVIFSAFYDDETGRLSGEYWCIVKMLSEGADCNNPIIDITGCDSQIKAVWKAVVTFIEWYNKTYKL